MYLDAFVLDQVRYFYDMTPTLPVVADSLRFGEQMVLRACMDCIFRHNHSARPEWFHAGTLVEFGKAGLTFFDWPRRELISR